MANHDTHSSSQELHHEPLPLKVYIGVFLGLLVLTGVTVGVSYLDLGPFDLLVAMIVAVAKASLVILYFMNLKHDHDRLNAVIFACGFLFLVIFTIPTMWDYYTRGDVDPDRGRYNTELPAPTRAMPAAEAPAAPDVPAGE